MRAHLFVVALVASGAALGATYVDDPLTAATFSGRGSQGGTFSSAGWTVTGEADAVWYEIADALPTARIEYTVTGLSLATSLSGADHDILTVYQAPTGQPEPVAYSPYFRNNDFKAFTRIFGVQEAGRGGAMKLEFAGCPRGDPWHHDTACPAGCEMSGIAYANGNQSDVGWDAATSYRMALEWSPGQMRFFRDGVLLGAVPFTGTYAPQPLRVRLGSPRHQGVYPGLAMMPLGVTIKDVLITGTPGPATPMCGAGGGAGGGSGGGAGGGSGGGGGTASPEGALADVTAAAWETGVFPDVNDLNVEADAAGAPQAIVYLRLPAPTGAVQRAVLTLHTATSASAAGGSGRVCAVADASWSETTMTWANRPAVGACTGTAISVDPDQDVQWDVTALFAAGAPGSLAIVSNDGNGAHYLSEGSERHARAAPHGDVGPRRERRRNARRRGRARRRRGTGRRGRWRRRRDDRRWRDRRRRRRRWRHQRRRWLRLFRRRGPAADRAALLAGPRRPPSSVTVRPCVRAARGFQSRASRYPHGLWVT